MIHIIGIPAVFVAGIVVGFKYGAKGVATVKAEIAKIEAEAVTDAKAVVARIKATIKI